MKLLLTGSTGFIGRNLLLRVLRENKYEQIYLVARNAEKLKSQLKVEGYPKLPETIKIISTEGPEWKLGDLPSLDHVVHIAGVLFSNSKYEFDRMNIFGTTNLLSQLKTPSRVVILSSQAAAGPSSTGPKTEKTEDSPITFYGESKLAMEKELKSQFPHLNYLCLRPPIVLGPRDTASLPLFKVAESPVIPKPGFGIKTYSYIGVNDLVDAILSALNSKQDFWNISSRYLYVTGGTVTDRDLLQMAAKVRGRQPVLLPLPHFLIKAISQIISTLKLENKVPSLSRERVKEIFPRGWVASSELFSKTFGWKPKETLYSILVDTAEWYQKNGQIKSRSNLKLSPQSR